MTGDNGALWQTLQYGRQAVEVQARPGTARTQGRPFVLLHDVQDIFPGAVRLQSGKRALAFMVDAEGNKLLPLRVPYLPETPMEVIVTEDALSPRSSLKKTPSSSILRTPSTTSLNSGDDLPERTSRPLRPARSSRQPSQSPKPPRQRLQQQEYAEEKRLVEQAQQQQLIEQARQMQLVDKRHQRQYSGSGHDLESVPHIKPPPIPASEVPALVIPRKPRQGSNISLSSEETRSQYRKSVMLYQSFLQHIRAGQTEQANVVKEDFRMHFSNLEVEMARNHDLQSQMLEMQQTMLEMQQNALDRLAVIQNHVQAILVQSYEMHECPIPRLFVVLPRELASWDSNNMMRNRFKLFFLCECGEHTKASHQHTRIPHHVHLVKHEGYELERPTEFFRRYGHYILKLLQMLKYGVTVGGFSVPAIVPTRASGQKDASGQRAKPSSFDNYNHSNLETGVNLAIEYLQQFLSQDDLGSPTEVHPDDMVETLEGSDLQRMRAFLKNKDEDHVLSNLYRIVTNDGYVKWVCQDHYRDTCNTQIKRELVDLINLNNGFFDEHHGRVEVVLNSPTVALQFYKALERARFVQELQIKLKWEMTYQDVKILRDALQRSGVTALELTCTASNAAGELLNRNKRAEPLWQILSNPTLRSFSISGYTGLFRRSTTEARPNGLRTFKTSEVLDWKKDSTKVIELLQMSPQLTDITVGCANVIETYKGIREAAAQRCHLTRLTLEAGHDERLSAQFEDEQALVSLDLVIPSLSSYSHLLKAADCISTLHINARTFGSYADSTPVTDLIVRNRNLTDLKIACNVSEFSNLYEAIRTCVLANRSSRLKKVCLYRGENQFFTPDIRTPHLVSLELMQMRIHDSALLNILNVHGSKLTKLRIDTEHWKPAHSTALREATRVAPTGSRLTHLYQTCSNVDEGVLRELSMVINRSNIVEYQLLVDQTFESNLDRSNYWVDYLTCVGEKLTSLIITCPEPNDWVVALGRAQFPAMERISFNSPSSNKEGHPDGANNSSTWM
ncbi:MAG: hypothetical protein J3Q66DRAFT_331690 [Benniella sp.]|nr:MAG: hypothetical protein J3Q66DRAFT_331690 [Benniella sp.]